MTMLILKANYIVVSKIAYLHFVVIAAVGLNGFIWLKSGFGNSFLTTFTSRSAFGVGVKDVSDACILVIRYKSK